MQPRQLGHHTHDYVLVRDTPQPVAANRLNIEQAQEIRAFAAVLPQQLQGTVLHLLAARGDLKLPVV
jgi:hypothetical protein